MWRISFLKRIRKGPLPRVLISKEQDVNLGENPCRLGQPPLRSHFNWSKVRSRRSPVIMRAVQVKRILKIPPKTIQVWWTPSVSQSPSRIQQPTESRRIAGRLTGKKTWSSGGVVRSVRSIKSMKLRALGSLQTWKWLGQTGGGAVSYRQEGMDFSRSIENRERTASARMTLWRTLTAIVGL